MFVIWYKKKFNLYHDNMAIIGYARISTFSQTLDLQLDALNEAGAEKVFHEQISGAKEVRPEFNRCMDYLREGDTLIVWKLDRLARTVKELLSIMNKLSDKGVEFISLKEQIDTKTPMGKFAFHIYASMIEFERDVARERTCAGLNAARARGRVGGRPSKLKDKDELALVEMYNSKKFSLKYIAGMFNITVPTIYRVLGKHNKTA